MSAVKSCVLHCVTANRGESSSDFCTEKRAGAKLLVYVNKGAVAEVSEGSEASCNYKLYYVKRWSEINWILIKSFISGIGTTGAALTSLCECFCILYTTNKIQMERK